MKQQGSCHCGAIRFEVEGQPRQVMSCNCSICSRKGSLLWFFNKNIIKHRFCPRCGIHPFAYGVDPKGNQMAAINVRCLEGIDFAKLPVQPFDGRSL